MSRSLTGIWSDTGYTFDYMMNSYVGTELKKRGYAYQLMLRYDPYKKHLRYADEDDYFIEVNL